MDYLDSFSGSKFSLFEKNNTIYLKKFYENINQRDIESFQKQKNFNNYKLKGFKISSAEILAAKYEPAKPKSPLLWIKLISLGAIITLIVTLRQIHCINYASVPT